MAFLPLDAPRGQLVVTVTEAGAGIARELARAGATSFRLNASHLQPPQLSATVSTLREQCPAAPIVVDLQGAKMRLGYFAERRIAMNERVRFALDADDAKTLPLPHRELFAAVKVGDTLSCDDDRIRLKVTSVEAAAIEALAFVPGTLRERKGVNLLEHPVDLADLIPSDQARVEALRGVADLAWAFSFMKDGSEVAWLRHRVPNAEVIGKVERREALEKLPAIDASVDATWICRGDLGAQLGMARLAQAVAQCEPRRMRVPMLMAGQVLEHLTEHAEPTRSEVCHLYDLVARGFAGIVLSDETALGREPVHAVEVAASLLASFAPTS
jgi:pyruvate kinase